MGRRKVSYYQVTCDYPEHTPELQTQLPGNSVYHLIGGSFAVCNNCWENRLVVETLLDILNITYSVMSVGKEE